MKIFHNPRCRKSRETLEILNNLKIKADIVEYLIDTPSQKELEEIIKALGIPAEALIRKSEKIYKEKFKGKTMSDKQWIKAMIQYPILIERPIVIKGKKAIIGRPPENVLQIL